MGVSVVLAKAWGEPAGPLSAANYTDCVLRQTSRAGVKWSRKRSPFHYFSEYLRSIRGAGAEEEQGQTGCLRPEGLMGELP